MADNIKSLSAERADRANDNTLISPAECCEDAAREIRSGERQCTSALVLTLDAGADGRGHSVGFYLSNLKSSEAIALLEVAKVRILQDMNHIPEC